MMELNADFARRAAVHAARLPWTPSPMTGVERRMLDRVGGEVARATSIVRYAPGSRFSEHVHGGGEEFLVLEGVFSDEHGDFPAGAYVRNPPTSSHTPGSGPGCVIFVKLWQFDPGDRTHVRIDTSKMPFLPAPDRPGVEVMPLFRDAREDVRLERWGSGTSVRLDGLLGGMELLVLDGSFSEGGDVFAAQSWLRLPDGATLDAVAGSQGCRAWVKFGHLIASAIAAALPAASAA
jgi:ChrR Cupin-like domain